jgi:hypothetical protein
MCEAADVELEKHVAGKAHGPWLFQGRTLTGAVQATALSPTNEVCKSVKQAHTPRPHLKRRI